MLQLDSWQGMKIAVKSKLPGGIVIFSVSALSAPSKSRLMAASRLSAAPDEMTEHHNN
ncbi:MAG: hypothetical protein LBE21_08440 [Pseudomonadales bacterium]|jgi:hypothetical protein|nr:hypothetical protein [Pseudomonadales bacterium]